MATSGFHPMSVLTTFCIHLYANAAFFFKFCFWLRKKIKNGEKSVPKRHEVTEASVQRRPGECY